MIHRILITGCNGQLGNEMQLKAKENTQYEYLFTDIEELDITNREAVFEFVETNEVDCVVNCAAYTAVDKAEDNGLTCHFLNVDAPGFLAEAVEGRKGCMIHVSTDYVFDGTNHTPYNEQDLPCPNSVYGKTKLLGEQNVCAHCSKSVIIRTAWLYSSFGNNFVKTMLRLGREKEELGVVFDQIGTPTYARDLADCIFSIINHGIVPGTYHFSNEGVISWYDFTKAIHRIAGVETCNVRPLHTDEYPAKAPRPSYSVLDKTKIKKTFGITVPYWEDSLRDCIKLIESK